MKELRYADQDDIIYGYMMSFLAWDAKTNSPGEFAKLFTQFSGPI